jgi:hypothetical protein
MMATSRPGTPREILTSAERRFPVRIRIAVPPGLGQRYALITAWLDENCGYDGWAMTPSGTRGLLNDALSIYFGDATLASGTQAGRRKSLGDSPLEGGGFELPVPRAMQAPLKAKIAGIGCMPPSIICGCRRWPSVKAESEISEPNHGDRLFDTK